LAATFFLGAGFFVAGFFAFDFVAIVFICFYGLTEPAECQFLRKCDAIMVIDFKNVNSGK
jgi:hypothetical protein